jgi:hypothetical protein
MSQRQNICLTSIGKIIIMNFQLDDKTYLALNNCFLCPNMVTKLKPQVGESCM